MLQVISRPLSTERYKTVSDKARARLINNITLSLLFFYTLFFVLSVSGIVPVTLNTSISRTMPTIMWLAVSGVYVGGILTVILNRLGYKNASAVTCLVAYCAGTSVITIPSGFVYAPAGASLFGLIMVGGFLLGGRGIIGMVLAGTLIMLTALAQREFIPDAPDNALYTAMVFMILFCATGTILWWFLRLQKQAQEEKVGQASRGRQELATLTTQLAQRISRHFVLTDLLDSTVDDIRKTYPDIYHVQIFLTDTSTNEARLAASTGEVGKALLRRKHSLPVGSRSVIGQVTGTGKYVIAVAGVTESVHKRNEFLPDTNAEAAFPLRLANNVIGALDLQSRAADAFDDDEDIPIFQSLADSIAIAVDNARLFEQTENRLQENQRLIEQMRGAMREVERLNNQLTARAWSNFLNYHGQTLGVTVDLESKVVRKSAELTNAIDTAIREGRLVQGQTRDQNVISAPLRVRGQVIGAMEFEVGSIALTNEDLELVNEVAERFSLALESARLYEESRRVAQRETTLNQITSRLQTTNSVDALLAETARGLQASLGANRVAIRLGMPVNGENGR